MFFKIIKDDIKLYAVYYFFIYLILVAGYPVGDSEFIWQHYFPFKVLVYTMACIFVAVHKSVLYGFSSSEILWACFKALILNIISVLILWIISLVLKYDLFFLFI